MTASNPYNWRRRLDRDSDMFFGREKENRRMMDMLSGKRPQCISLVGERRIGKSSLAYRVCQQLENQNGVLAVYIDCDEMDEQCDSTGAFYQLLNRHFQEALKTNKNSRQRLGVTADKPIESYRDFKRFLTTASQKEVAVLVFLDEFEHLPDRPFADNSFFSNLRALGDSPAYPLAFITMSRTPLKELTHGAIQSSCFYNIFETIYVGLLDHKSIKALRSKGFQEEGFHLTGEEHKKIAYYAGDYAFFNQVACSYLWDAKHYKEPPDWDGLEVKLLDYHETLWESRTRDEQVLLKKLLKKNKTDDFGLKELKLRGLVTKAVDRYYFFSGFFEELVKERLETERKFSGEKIVDGIEKTIDLAVKGRKVISGKGD